LEEVGMIIIIKVIEVEEVVSKIKNKLYVDFFSKEVAKNPQKPVNFYIL